MKNEVLTKLVNNMNVYETIFIIGAGVSMKSGMPNISSLSNILWKIFDEDTNLFEELRRKIKSNENSAKKVINSKYDNIKIAFEIVEKNPILLQKFKEIFVEQSNKKNKNSIFHKKLSELLHSNKISKVISMNWDNLLETSWRELYGTNIDREVLLKPHGDVNYPKGKWTLPNSDGNLSIEVQKVLLDDNKFPLNIVIIGYSENDSIIKKNLIDQLEKTNSVFRVNPNCTGENSIPMLADDFICELAKSFKLSNKGWEHLNFDNQKVLEDIILNNKPTHLNAKNTPRLSIFNKSYESLLGNNIVKIMGSSGTGVPINTA